MRPESCSRCGSVGFDLLPCLFCDTAGVTAGEPCPCCGGEGFAPCTCAHCDGGGTVYLREPP